MNAKTLGAILKISPSSVTVKAKRLGIKKIKGQYDFNEKDISIMSVRKRPDSNLRKLMILTGMTRASVLRVVHRTSLKLSKDYDRLVVACYLYKTKEYTIKGIKARI